jgi:prepilin signal peptidase PulO-like enzyme (type II secretory pathway)
MGWFLGFVGGLSAFVLGFWLGALYAIAALVLRFASSRTSLCPALKPRLKNLTLKSELPLAPFLIAGALLVYLTGVDVTGISLLLQ